MFIMLGSNGYLFLDNLHKAIMNFLFPVDIALNPICYGLLINIRTFICSIVISLASKFCIENNNQGIKVHEMVAEMICEKEFLGLLLSFEGKRQILSLTDQNNRI